jgi:hypothetical protein
MRLKGRVERGIYKARKLVGSTRKVTKSRVRPVLSRVHLCTIHPVDQRLHCTYGH